MKKITRQLSILAALFAPIAANAIPVTLTFEVENFTNLDGPAPPTNPVVGTIVYEASDLLSPIDSLTSIALVIDGHSYDLAEAGFVSPHPFFPDSDTIGGIAGNPASGLDPVLTASGFTNDFFLRFDRVANVPQSFVYTTLTSPGGWRSSDFTSFSRTAGVASVPEPGTLSLSFLGLVLIGFGAARR